MYSPPRDPEVPDRPLEIVIPDPCLVVLCGPSGSGKTTFSNCHFRSTQVVSSDRCRALISDSETFGAETSGRAFQLLHETIRHRLALRRMTIADTTALDRASRAEFLEHALALKVPAVLIVFAVREEECRRRSALRDRDVGGRVIARQHRLLQTSLLSLSSEPFHSVHILNEDMLERVTIRLESDPLEAPRPILPSVSIAPPQPTVFEGWLDPWNSEVEERTDSEKTVCHEVQEVLGSVSDESRRAALEALTSAEVDPRWILFRPSPPAAPPSGWSETLGLLLDEKGPYEGKASCESLSFFCEALAADGFGRVSLEAWPSRAERVSLVVAREPYYAARSLGIEGWGSIVREGGATFFDEATTSQWLKEIASDLDNSAFFARNRTPILAGQALAVWTRAGVRRYAEPEDLLLPDYFASNDEIGENRVRPRLGRPETLRLWLTDLLAPRESDDPDRPEFLWNVAETNALAEGFGSPPRRILDVRDPETAVTFDAVDWWVQWWKRAGWDIVLTRATRIERDVKTGTFEEACDVGWLSSPWKLTGGIDPDDGARPQDLWECRRRATAAVSQTLEGRLWRPWVMAGWSLDPVPRAGVQPDLFFVE